jgi:hypothetical protein
MKSVITIDALYEAFHVLRPARILWLTILSTLLVICFLTETMGDEISLLPPIVSYAFDDESKHMVVASCLKGVG